MWQHQGYKTVTFPWIRPTRRELPFRADLMFAAFRVFDRLKTVRQFGLTGRIYALFARRGGIGFRFLSGACTSRSSATAAYPK